MILRTVFERFVARSPLAVMAWATLNLLTQIVCGMRPSVRSAYRASSEALPVSPTSVYNKLTSVVPHVSVELVRFGAARLAPVIESLGPLPRASASKN